MTKDVDLVHKAIKQTKRNSNSLSLLFDSLLMNSLGKQAVSTGLIKQRIEIALLFLCVCFKTNQSVLLKISRYSFLQNGRVL